MPEEKITGELESAECEDGNYDDCDGHPEQGQVSLGWRDPSVLDSDIGSQSHAWGAKDFLQAAHGCGFTVTMLAPQCVSGLCSPGKLRKCKSPKTLSETCFKIVSNTFGK